MKTVFKITLAVVLLIAVQSCTKEGTTGTELEETANVISAGNRIVRDVLGTDIGEMKFDTSEANEFRIFITNSVLFAKTNDRNSGVGGTDFSEFQEQLQFCADGSFTYNASGFSSINSGSGGNIVTETASSYGGNWEVAALPDNLRIIIMHGTDPDMLKDFPNGIIPFFVANHGADFVALPSGDLYNRTPNQGCN